MEFVAIEEFTHSDGKIVQGGFVTGMLDAPMAHLLMYLFDEKIIPMTLDINVSFLAPTRQGNLTAFAEIIQLGGTAFMASRLIQDNNLVATNFYCKNYSNRIKIKLQSPKINRRDIYLRFL